MGSTTSNAAEALERQRLVFGLWYFADAPQNSTSKSLHYFKPTRQACEAQFRDGYLCTDIGFGQKHFRLGSHLFPPHTTFHLVSVNEAEILTNGEIKYKW